MYGSYSQSSRQTASVCTDEGTAVDLSAKPNVNFGESRLKVRFEAIMKLAEKLFESQKLYCDTGGAYTSALCDGEKFLIASDDIGRHNTLDKIKLQHRFSRSGFFCYT